ncbi:MAG: hypothetical protein R3Y53_04765 [Bacillota bacterium]
MMNALQKKYIKLLKEKSELLSIQKINSSNDMIEAINSALSDLEYEITSLDATACDTLMQLRVEHSLDFLNEPQKMKSIAFADAINAIEGTCMSETTCSRIDDWKKGNLSFEELTQKTLSLYGIV